jgi:hypothetical protein
MPAEGEEIEMSHNDGHDMQYAINANIEAAKHDCHDIDECWACYDGKRKISVGSLCFGNSPLSLVEITCPVCDGTRESVDAADKIAGLLESEK